VLRELQPRLDEMLETRLREALAPALARAADGLIRDARGELAPALRDLVQAAVARALQSGAGR
jgi:alkylhydroperoxidase family enzyme